MPTLHPIVARILEERGIADVKTFLEPSYGDRPDPFLMKDMDKAVSRIFAAIEKKENIAAWTDYDCDGIPAGALLADFFRTIGYPLRSYIPERSEGYGLNEDGIRRLKEEGISLIITADIGITNIAEVAFAKEHGIDVIVSDHHLPASAEHAGGPGTELPEAVAVLNPHRTDCAYPFKELCGTGVAFKLVEALIRRNMDTACPYFSWKEGQEKWLLDLVALATVADMVELSGENRTLVKYGLMVMRKGRRKGLRALIETMRMPMGSATEDDIAFSIAPKINAASRMQSPSLALELLTTEDDARAKELGKALVKLNDARKLEGARVAKEVKRRLENRAAGDVIVLGNSDWNPALLGIAASNIVEAHKRTVCLWGKEGELIKGSCRSDGSVNIVSLMRGASRVFEDFGGHERSGGFSLKAEAVHELPVVLQESYDRLRVNEAMPSPREPVRTHTMPLSVSELSETLYRALRLLAPFGMGNPKPVFSVDTVLVERILRFGAHKEHARLSVRDETGHAIEAIAFFVSRLSCSDTFELLSKGDQVSLGGTLEQSFFANKKELRLRLEALSMSSG